MIIKAGWYKVLIQKNFIRIRTEVSGHLRIGKWRAATDNDEHYIYAIAL